MYRLRLLNLHWNKTDHKELNLNSPAELKEASDWAGSFASLYTPNGCGKWKDIELVADDSFTHSLVIDCCYPQYQNGKRKEIFDPSKTIVIKAEPKVLRDRFDPSLYNDSLDKENLKTYEFLTLWGWLGLNYDQINTPSNFEKTKTLSTIISANSGLPGHIERLNFLPYLDTIQNADYQMYGDERGNRGIFQKYKHYAGKLEQKKDGLCAYKYHYNSENCIQDNYFSEKFAESLLSECLTLYTGCSNLEKYIDERAFIRIDLSDYERALVKIKRAIKENQWEQRIDIIRQEKQKMLNELSPLNLVWSAIHNEPLYYER